MRATTAEEITMDRCPNCGATVRVGAKFCTTCGMRLPEPAAPATETSQASRSPFDSTSTVASRWPSRSVYGSSEPSTAEPDTNGEVATVADGAESTSETDAVVAGTTTEPEVSEPSSTWGAWTAPPAPELETEPASESEETGATVEPSTWEEGATVEAEVEEPQEEEPAASSWGSSGETDFLQLPEQPDPAAWKSIESELAGAASEPSDEAAVETEGEEVADLVADEAVSEEAEGEEEFDEEEAEEVEAAQTAPSPSIERAYDLLDELRDVLAGIPAEVAPLEPEVAPSVDFEGVRPSDEAVARFAELRAAVDAAKDHPRDIDTMLDLSSRLDVISELHDSFLSLKDAVFGEEFEVDEVVVDED
jgi:hypothetical protein